MSKLCEEISLFVFRGYASLPSCSTNSILKKLWISQISVTKT